MTCFFSFFLVPATFEVAFFRLILTLHSRLNFPADNWKLVSTSNKTGVAIAMEPRIAYTKYSSNALHALYALEKHIKASGLEEKLLHLIKLRASQINGCAYCIDMHSKDARAAGDTEMRLYALNAWRETPFFTPRERAALAWTEALTLISENHAPDELYEATCKEFNEQELVDLTYAIAAINAWNRLAISMRVVPGQYQPAKGKTAAS